MVETDLTLGFNVVTVVVKGLGLWEINHEFFYVWSGMYRVTSVRLCYYKKGHNRFDQCLRTGVY